MPTPRKGETEQAFVSRCIPIVLKDGTTKDQKQAEAICYSMFKKRSLEDLVMDDITMDYDEKRKRAVLTFPKGKAPLVVSNITLEQAQRFKERHAAEFAKRDCCLQTPAVELTR